MRLPTITRRRLMAGLSTVPLPRIGSSAGDTGNPMMLWYRKPADRWLDSLPIGNGRLGAMIFGGIERERVALNESTMWSGGPSDDHENPSALEHLGEIRRLFFSGRYIEARDLCAKHLLGRQGSYGTHLPVADLWLHWETSQGAVRDYRRC